MVPAVRRDIQSHSNMYNVHLITGMTMGDKQVIIIAHTHTHTHTSSKVLVVGYKVYSILLAKKT